MPNFSNTERKIRGLFMRGVEFIYRGKVFKVVSNCCKPTVAKGECKTDVYFVAMCNRKSYEFKISVKQENADFLENKIQYERAKEIFGADVDKILSNSIKSIRDVFEKQPLINFVKYGRTESNCIKLGWKFELLNEQSGKLSGKLNLNTKQKIDVYSGSNLPPTKRNALINGKIVKDSGVANFMLIVNEYENLSLEKCVSKLIPIEEYVKVDGRIQRLGLMSIIVGEQASGKSVCKDVIDIWLKQMDEADMDGRLKEEEWRRKRKNRRANEKLDPEPNVVIRDVPITISCSTLLKRLKNCQGHTLYSFSSELDTLRKTNGAGSWSSKYDIYRLAFDHDEWGQDYNSDQAESGIVTVGYNWSILGTYGALKKCFRQDNIENGLSSRIMLAEMPDSAFAPLPQFHERKEKDANVIQEVVRRLKSKCCYVDTPRLRNAIGEWVEQKRLEAMKTIDRVKDTYRRRAAVIGMRCGVIAYLLSGELETDEVISFALMIADYVLSEQCKLFGKMLQKEYAADIDDRRSSMKNRIVFEQIPEVFQIGDILSVRDDISATGARSIIHRWKEAGWIHPLEKVKGNTFATYQKDKVSNTNHH